MDTLQAAVLEIQRAARRFDGDVHKILMDDKGFSITVAFGLPRQAHEDDAQRGIEAGLAISRELRAAALRASIGIASGKLFCGDYGGRDRREYCLIGPAINTAARLMELAAGAVLCDATTAEAVHDRVSFSVCLFSTSRESRPWWRHFVPCTFRRGIAISAAAKLSVERAKSASLRDALQSHHWGRHHR